MEKVKAKIVRGVMLEFVRDCTTAPAPYKTQQVTHKMVHAQLICVPAQVSKCLSGVCQDNLVRTVNAAALQSSWAHVVLPLGPSPLQNFGGRRIAHVQSGTLHRV